MIQKTGKIFDTTLNPNIIEFHKYIILPVYARYYTNYKYII